MANKAVGIKISITASFCFFFASFFPLLSQPSFEGEVLRFDVSFWGVKLGKIVATNYGEEFIDSKHTIKSEFVISSDGVSGLAKRKEIYTSWGDPSLGFSRKFMIKVYDSEGMNHEIIDFLYKENKIKIDKFERKELIEKFDYDVEKKYNEGVSLIYLIRKYAHLKRKIIVPMIISSDTTSCALSLFGKRETIKIDAFEKPIKTLYASAELGETNLFGMKGVIEIWVSDDEARVPIKAAFNIVIGDVVAELTEYEREGWTPPAIE